MKRKIFKTSSTMDVIGVSSLNPLDEYELIHRIGSGTYGDVFKVGKGGRLRRAVHLLSPFADD